MTDTHYVFETEGVVLPRVEEDTQPRTDWVYMVGPARGARAASALGPPAACAVVFPPSVVDSDDETEPGGGEGQPVASAGRPTVEGGDKLIYEGDRLDLEPGDGAWVPVRREVREPKPVEKETEVALQSRSSPTDVAPGLWSTG